MVCPNISLCCPSSQSAPHFYAGLAMRPSFCQQLPLLLVAFCWLLGFSFRVPGKHSTFLSDGVFPSYHPIVWNLYSLRRELLAIGDGGMAGAVYSQHTLIQPERYFCYSAVFWVAKWSFNLSTCIYVPVTSCRMNFLNSSGRLNEELPRNIPDFLESSLNSVPSHRHLQ